MAGVCNYKQVLARSARLSEELGFSIEDFASLIDEKYLEAVAAVSLFAKPTLTSSMRLFDKLTKENDCDRSIEAFYDFDVDLQTALGSVSLAPSIQDRYVTVYFYENQDGVRKRRAIHHACWLFWLLFHPRVIKNV